MVPQSDPPPKPLGVTVPHYSLYRWKWAQKLKPLPLHSSEALDVYLWPRGVFGWDLHNHQKNLKFSENWLNRLASFKNPMVLIYECSLLMSSFLSCHKESRAHIRLDAYGIRKRLCVENPNRYWSYCQRTTSGSSVRSWPVKILDFVLAFEDNLHLNK